SGPGSRESAKLGHDNGFSRWPSRGSLHSDRKLRSPRSKVSGIKAGRPRPELWESGHRELRKKEIKGHPCASTGLEAPSPERATPDVLLSPPQTLLLIWHSSFATSPVAACSPLDPLAATRAHISPVCCFLLQALHQSRRSS